MTKRLIQTFLLACLVPVSAFAAPKTFDFTFFGHSAGNDTMVSCDYATPLVQDWMESFGATHVDIECIGGIQPFGVSPLMIQATYEMPILAGGGHLQHLHIASGTLPGQSNCAFDTGILSALFRDFANVRVNSRQDGCFSADSFYSYDLAVSLPL